MHCYSGSNAAPTSGIITAACVLPRIVFSHMSLSSLSMMIDRDIRGSEVVCPIEGLVQVGWLHNMDG